MYSLYFNRQPTAVVFDPNNDIVLKTATLSVGINSSSNSIPEKVAVYQNYPNPFNPSTKIKFDIPNGRQTTSNVQLIIYDVLGKEISTLVNEQLAPGTYSVDWNASDFPSGIYFCRLSSGDFVDTKRMLLVK